jgi:hypothetical protein
MPDSTVWFFVAVCGLAAILIALVIFVLIMAIRFSGRGVLGIFSLLGGAKTDDAIVPERLAPRPDLTRAVQASDDQFAAAVAQAQAARAQAAQAAPPLGQPAPGQIISTALPPDFTPPPGNLPPGPLFPPAAPGMPAPNAPSPFANPPTPTLGETRTPRTRNYDYDDPHLVGGMVDSTDPEG